MQTGKYLKLILLISFILIDDSWAYGGRSRGSSRDSGGGRGFEIPLLCPNRMATEPKSGLDTFVVFQSTRSFSDFKIYNGPRGWSSGALDRLKEEGFDPYIPTLIYSHAFMQNSNQTWLIEIRKQHRELVENPGPNRVPYNLFIYDWSTYSNKGYPIAVSWVPSLGTNLANFIKQLDNHYSLNMSNFQMISFSLSTHISGITGRELASSGLKVSQITALDPTRVCFQNVDNSFGRDYSLRSTDADLVVVRHYDWFGFGSQRNIGGLDIFVNGGTNQPVGGRSSNAPLDARLVPLDVTPTSYRGSRANHNHASGHEVATHGDPMDECHEVAYKCASYSNYLKGQCASCGSKQNKCYYIDTMARLALPESEVSHHYPKTTMHLKSGRLPNPCLYLYQALLELKEGSNSTVESIVTTGSLSFSPISYPETGFSPRYQTTRSVSTFTSLVETDGRIEEDEGVLIKFERSVKPEDRRRVVRSIKSLQLNYMSNALAAQRAKASRQFCPTDGSQSELRVC